ncbi:MAG: hypothetical protein U9R26_01930 [Campylobacterota bacterium]|nr:hypothetical protein [Campylobacterota bacterium]
MSELNREPIEIMGATVPFFTYTLGEDQIFEFDTSKCGPPDPMVNAMAGLKHIDTPNKKLIMINHKKPAGLLEKIAANYNIEIEDMEDGRVQLIFSFKEEESEKANLNDSSCDG